MLKTIKKTALVSSIITFSVAVSADVSFIELPIQDRAGSGHSYLDVSNNGDIVFTKLENGTYVGYVWTQSSGVQPIPQSTVVPTTMNAVSINNDGTKLKFGNEIFMGGQSTYQASGLLSALSPDGKKAGVYNYNQGIIEVNLENGSEQTINDEQLTANYRIADFSNDGETALLADGSMFANFFNPTPYFLKEADGSINEIAHRYGSIADLSGDGSSVIGRSYFCENSFACTLITNGTGTFELTSENYFPEALNQDGSIAVLSYRDYENNNWRGAIWDAINGIRHIDELLSSQGIDISNWDQVRLTNISDNGYFIVGDGVNPAGESRVFLIDATPQCSPNGLL